MDLSIMRRRGPPRLPLIRPGWISLRLPFARAQTGGAMATTLGADDATWSEVAADVPRQYGSARRLRIEGQRTNSIRNPRADGLVPGTPGTAPTNWVLSAPTGLTRTLSVETAAGMTWLRVRYSGTTTSSSSFGATFDGVSSASAAQNQSWWAAAWVEVLEATGFTLDWRLEAWAFNSSSAFLSTGSAPASGKYVAGDTGKKLLTSGRSLPDAATAYVQANMRQTTAPGSGVPVVFEYRVAWPQLELGSFASTPILPATTGASTRGADLVSASLASLGIPASGACTLLGTFMIPQAAPSGVVQTLAVVDDGSDANRFTVRNAAGGSNIVLVRHLANVNVESAAFATTPGTPFRAGLTIRGDGSAALSVNGAAAQSVSGGLTSGATTFRVGSTSGGVSNLFGDVGYLDIIRAPVSDAQLQALVAAMPLT